MQSGFSDCVRRMKYDHKPMTGRKRLDLVTPLGMPFVVSHKPVSGWSPNVMTRKHKRVCRYLRGRNVLQADFRTGVVANLFWT